MSNYEMKPGQGSIFKNERKVQENHPDYRGEFITPSGEKLTISCWVKEGKSGKKYFSCSIQEPYEKAKTENNQSAPAEESDGLPF